ncbi:MAG: hypothetical protein LBU13_05380 [Synergistaceae bacterium]|nr:hypothetical protein [Synergistaceae bacterium]
MIDAVLGAPASTTNRGLVSLATEAEATSGTDAAKAMTPVTTTILYRNSLRAAVEAASGGKVTVLFDDQGNPSYMRRFSPVTNKELYRHYFASDAAWNASVFKAIEGQAHPAFLKNGKMIKELLVGQYLASNINNRACSIPGANPWNVTAYNTALLACKNKGAGWIMGTAHIWGFLQALCLRQKFQPRGNSNYGMNDENPLERGIRADGRSAIINIDPGITKAGTGPASWNHDGTESGVADLVGNIWEWGTLMKLMDGKIMMPPDNDIDLPEADWPDTGARYDSTGGTSDGANVTNGGTPVISDEITKYTGVPGGASGGVNAGIIGAAGFRSLTKKSDYSIPAVIVQAGLAPVTLVGGSYETDNALKGAIWVQNYGEVYPLFGGSWYAWSERASSPGLGALRFFPRTCGWSVTTILGHRPAFLLV